MRNLSVKMQILSALLWVYVTGAEAQCLLVNSDRTPVSNKNDALFLVLNKLESCPQNVQALKNVLQQAGLRTLPAMVANRGRHNPDLGSFSFFEEVTGKTLTNISVNQGEFFLGHFTDNADGVIILDQTPEPKKLLIELIVWDRQKQLYNFYELIGGTPNNQWFYRGDSVDALLDNTYLYRDVPQGKTRFGNTMRCSGCHVSGEPIMKELNAPHNDWWTTARPLNLSPNRASDEVTQLEQTLRDASDFSKSVIAGINLLGQSPVYQHAKNNRSLQEQLRPLFCTTEINLESDNNPLDDLLLSNIHIPSASLVNPLLASATLSITKVDYTKLLNTFNMHFPETKRQDADHAWLTPVKGFADQLAIQALIDQQLVDAKFVNDVLAIDLAKPLFSAARCQLLKLLPNNITSGWLSLFKANLDRSTLPAAHELLYNLNNTTQTPQFYAAQAQAYLDDVKQRLQSATSTTPFFEKLLVTRAQAFKEEISQNPRGQILEPGFRVIFPLSK